MHRIKNKSILKDAANIYLFKVNIITNFEQTSHLFLVFLLLTLNK